MAKTLEQMADAAFTNLDRTVAAEVAKGGENAQLKKMQKQMAEMKKMLRQQKEMLRQQKEMLRQQQLARRIAYLWRTLRRAVVLGPIVGYWMHVTAAPESRPRGAPWRTSRRSLRRSARDEGGRTRTADAGSGVASRPPRTSSTAYLRRHRVTLLASSSPPCPPATPLPPGPRPDCAHCAERRIPNNYPTRTRGTTGSPPPCPPSRARAAAAPSRRRRGRCR